MLKVPVTPEDHSQGDDKALITLVEYGDYQCPYCGMAYPVVKQLQEHYGDRLRFVFRNFPLSEAHPYAEAAAETVEFASDYNRFWDMHDLIYENQKRLSLPFLLECAQQLDLPVDELEIAIEKKTYANKIRQHFLGGVRSGVNGTPTFFINDHRYNGPVDFDGFVSLIELALAQ